MVNKDLGFFQGPRIKHDFSNQKMLAQERGSTFQCRVSVGEKQGVLFDEDGKPRLWKVELRRIAPELS